MMPSLNNVTELDALGYRTDATSCADARDDACETFNIAEWEVFVDNTWFLP